ncbi:UNVERIFIED_ORG: hypothetical protein BDU10_6833 [Burkholderia sp. CF145]|jgi:hypothetical protein|nr:hypothetical protein PMI06_000901 [Burkholderia sp. BT03]SKD07761.1 hypothetical protein SAMN06266956_10167 [Paraburkholderia hospita]
MIPWLLVTGRAPFGQGSNDGLARRTRPWYSTLEPYSAVTYEAILSKRNVILLEPLVDGTR